MQTTHCLVFVVACQLQVQQSSSSCFSYPSLLVATKHLPVSLRPGPKPAWQTLLGLLVNQLQFMSGHQKVLCRLKPETQVNQCLFFPLLMAQLQPASPACLSGPR